MAIYYFKPTGLAGNTGLSDAQAWPLSKHNSVAFAPGDIIRFNLGTSFSGNITISHNGGIGNFITYDVYGTTGHNPIIDNGMAASPVITVNANYIKINNIYLKNSTASNGMVYVPSGVHDVYLNNVAFNTGLRGFNATNAGSGGIANLSVLNCWFLNIRDTGTGQTFAHGGGNGIQINNCNGSGQEYAFNKFYYPTIPNNVNTANIFVGDVLSIYQSKGTATSYILVHDNWFRGGSSNTQETKASIIVGDVGGQYQNCYSNLTCNGGYSGIQMQGGTFIKCNNNKIYSDKFPYNSAPALNFGNYSGVPCNNQEAGGNQCNWTNSFNNAYSWFIQTAGGSTSTGASGGAPLATPTNWATNTAQFSRDLSVTNAMLPDPLFLEYDWDVATGTNPPSISYSPPTNTFVANTAISTWTPSNAGDDATSWGISPALPTGLSFNTTTGVITGTATASHASTNYTVTATNSAGSDTFVINVTVLIDDPNPSYSPGSNVYTVGTPITTWTPSNSGGAATSWSISPSILPLGLNFNTSTGVITGTPTNANANATYTITANNAGGSNTTTIDIQVNALPGTPIIIYRNVHLI